MQPWSRRHGPLRRRFVIVTVATIVALVSLFRGSSHPPAVGSDGFISAPTTEDEDLGVAPIEEDKGGDALDDGAPTSDGREKRPPTPTFAEPCRLPAWTPRRCFRYSSLTPTLGPDACNTTRHGTMESAQGFVAAAACSSVRGHADGGGADDTRGSSKSAGRCGFWQTGSFGPAFRRCVTARLRASRAALPSKLRHSRRCDATVAGPQSPSRWAFERRRSPQRRNPSVFFDINANAAADPSSTNRDRACTEDILLSIKGLHRSDLMAALVASLRRDVTHAPTSGHPPSLSSVPRPGSVPTGGGERTSPKQGAKVGPEARSKHTHARRKAPGKSLSQTLSAAAVGPGVMSFIGDSSQRNLFHRLVFALRGRSFVSDDSLAETMSAAAALRHSNSSSIDDAAVFFKTDDVRQPQERRDHANLDAGGGGGGGVGEEYQEVLEHYYHADAVYAVFPSGRDALYVFQSGQYLPPEAWRLLHSVLPEGASVQSTFEAKRPMAWAPAGAQWAAADAAMRADRLTAIAERKRATAATAIEELSDLPRHEYQTRMAEIMDAVFGLTEDERRLLFSTAPVADPAPFFVGGAKAKHGRDSVADAALPSRLRAGHIDDLGNPKRGLIEYNQPLDQADPLQDPRQASRGPSAARKKTPVSVGEDDTVPLLVLFHQNVLSRARPDTGAVINDKHYTDHMAALRDGVDKLRERYTAAPAATVSTASSGTTTANGNQEEQPIHVKKQTDDIRGADGVAATRRRTMSSATATVGPAKDGSVVLVGPRPHVVFASVNYWIRNLLKDGPKFHEGIDHHLKLYALAADPWRRLTALPGMPGDKTMDRAHNARPGPSAGTSLEKNGRDGDPSTRGDTKGTTVPPPPIASPLVLHIVATTPHATRSGDQSKFDTALATLRAMKLQWVAEHAEFTAKYANDRSIAGGAGDRLSGEAQGWQRRRQWTPPPLLEMPRWRSAWAVLTAAERAVVARSTRRIMIDAESIAVAATGDHGLLGPTSNRAVAAAPYAQQPARPRIDEEAPMKQAPTMGLQRPRGAVSKVDSLHFMCGWFPLMQPIAHHRDIDALRIGRTGCRDPFNLAVLRAAFASLPPSTPKDL